uniref:Secreted protein n=1 Tax=Macrostomum lignano TaxID=282301 RepID=A0A1I8FCY1_9PLAT
GEDCAGGSDSGGEEVQFDPSSTSADGPGRLLYHLSGQFTSLGGGKRHARVQGAEVKKSRCILLHYGLLKISWDWLILLFTLLHRHHGAVPMRPTATPRQEGPGTSRQEDAGASSTCLATVSLPASGQVVYCQRLSSPSTTQKLWFFLDLLAGRLPFDMIIIISKAVSSNLGHGNAWLLLLLISMFALSAIGSPGIWLCDRAETAGAEPDPGRSCPFGHSHQLISVRLLPPDFLRLWIVEVVQRDDMKAPFNFQCSSVDEDRSGNASSGCSEGGPTKILALHHRPCTTTCKQPHQHRLSELRRGISARSYTPTDSCLKVDEIPAVIQRLLPSTDSC